MRGNFVHSKKLPQAIQRSFSNIIAAYFQQPNTDAILLRMGKKNFVTHSLKTYKNKKMVNSHETNNALTISDIVYQV